MTTRLHIDLETRSQCDLRKCGAYVYAAHPTTEILCAAYAYDDEPPRIWYPRRSPIPDDLAVGAEDPGVLLTAHNASFERTILSGAAGRRYGFDGTALRATGRWDCTAARAALAGLPRTLEGAGAALDLDVRKDKDGHALMMRMCKPKPKTGVLGVSPQWVEDDASLARLGAYCLRDVATEQAVDRVVPQFPETEREVWRMTERMNDRGVKVDTDLLYQVAMLIEDAERDINAKLSRATGGAVLRVSDHMALTRWLVSSGIDDAAETGVGKAALAALLERDDLDPVIRGALVMRRDGGKSSASKYRAICDRVSADGRIRGVLVYCGAAATGRWSSRGAQLHNLPRGGAIKDPLQAIYDLIAGATLDEIEYLHGPPLVVASEILRPVFMAE